MRSILESYVSIILIFLIFGCDQSNIEKVSCRLEKVEIIDTESGSKTDEILLYQKDKVVVIRSTEVPNDNICCDSKDTITLELDDEGYVIKSYSTNTPNNLFIYQYDNNHLLVQRDYWQQSTLYRTTFEYNANSQVIKAQFKTGEYIIYEYSDPAAKNYFQQKYYQSDTLYSVTQFEFDSNPNPYGKLAIALTLNYESENNLIKAQSGNWFRMHTYVYNNLGYPESCIEQRSYTDFVQTYNYTYGNH